MMPKLKFSWKIWLKRKNHEFREDICNMYCRVFKNHKEIKLKSNKTKPPFFLTDKKL